MFGDADLEALEPEGRSHEMIVAEENLRVALTDAFVVRILRAATPEEAADDLAKYVAKIIKYSTHEMFELGQEETARQRRVFAGILSTTPAWSDKHPTEVEAYLKDVLASKE